MEINGTGKWNGWHKLKKIFHLCDFRIEINNRPRKMSNEKKKNSWNERQNWTQKNIASIHEIYIHIVWSCYQRNARYIKIRYIDGCYFFCQIVSFCFAFNFFFVLCSYRFDIYVSLFILQREINRLTEWYFISIAIYFSGSSITCHPAFDAAFYISHFYLFVLYFFAHLIRV